MTVITSASQLCTLPIQGICQGGQPVMSFNFGAGKKSRVKEAFRFQLTPVQLLHLPVLAAHDAGAGGCGGHLHLGYGADRLHHMVHAHLHGGPRHGRSDRLPAELYGAGSGQRSASCWPVCAKIILLIPLIFILPHLLPDPVFGVFLAEPVSDILAATITAITFFAVR